MIKRFIMDREWFLATLVVRPFITLFSPILLFHFHVHRQCVRIPPKADRQWDGDGINSVCSKVLHIFEIIQFLCGIFVLSS